MDRRRWIKLTSISGEGIRSFLPLPNPSLFISVNGRHKHAAPPARAGRENRPVRKNLLVWEGVPVRIDLEDEPDLVLEFDLMAEGDLRDVGGPDRHFGEVNIPVNDLLAEGPHGSLCCVSYQVWLPRDGMPNGTLSFSYRIYQQPLPPRPHTYLPPTVYLSMEVVAAILAMLPAKNLMKFRCVCKSWNSLVQDDPYFAAQQYSNNSKKNPGFVTLICKGFFSDYLLNYFPYVGSKVHKIDFSSDKYYYHLTNSCNGLIGVYARDVFYMANPSIMKLAKLPRGSSHVPEGSSSMPLAGIGFESSTAVYKAVRIFTRKYYRGRPVSVGCEVFSLGGRSWQPVEDPPVPFRYMEQGKIFEDPCSVVEGAMYWTVPCEVVMMGLLKPEIALSFDLREEKFSFLLHPERSSRPKDSSLVEIRGSLCIVDKLMDPQLMKIWTLKDRRSSEWVKHYSIDLSRTCSKIVESMRPLTIDGRRIALLCRWGQIYYDLMTMRIVHHTRTDRVHIEFVRPYTESLVWPFCN